MFNSTSTKKSENEIFEVANQSDCDLSRAGGQVIFSVMFKCVKVRRHKIKGILDCPEKQAAKTTSLNRPVIAFFIRVIKWDSVTDILLHYLGDFLDALTRIF